MIPHVVAQDLIWTVVALGLYRLAPQGYARRVAAVMVAYTLLEATCHVPMEAFAARILGLL